MGEIGKPEKERRYEPIPADEPIREPVPAPVPSPFPKKEPAPV